MVPSFPESRVRTGTALAPTLGADGPEVEETLPGATSHCAEPDVL